MQNSSKLERFDATLNAMEAELGNLKQTSAAYLRLQALVISSQLIIKKQEEYSNQLEELVLQHVKKQQEIEAAFEEIEAANQKHHEDLKKLNLEIGKDQSERIEQLRKENKSFYLDFEQTLKIKLGENKSEIKTLIEAERSKIQEILISELDKRFAPLQATQKATKTIVLVFGIVSLLALIGILLKLFLF